MTIYSYIEVLHEVSGVQKVLLDIHNGLKKYYSAKIISYIPYKDIIRYFDIPETEYQQIKSITDIKDGIILTHERKACTRCCLYSYLPWNHFKIIHIQHSIYNNLKWLSLYPKTIISISDKVTNNLINYFNVPSQNIHKIHNGIIDVYNSKPEIQVQPKRGRIKIAYIARIDKNKRQIEIVKKLKGKLHPNIQIDFIGNGPLYNDLLNEIGSENVSFKALGYCANINKIMPNYDYVMLFSIKEGLPITLIEGCMHGKPLIVNDAGGNLEIGIQGYNAFNAYSWDELSKTINNLINIPISQYERMSQNSREHYLKEFEYSQMINKYKKIIEEYNS